MEVRLKVNKRPIDERYLNFFKKKYRLWRLFMIDAAKQAHGNFSIKAMLTAMALPKNPKPVIRGEYVVFTISAFPDNKENIVVLN